MLPFTLAFLCGDILLQFFSNLPSQGWVLVALLASTACYFKKNRFRVLILGFLLGFAWSVQYAHRIADFSLPADWEGQVIQVKGVIASLPRVSRYQSSFLFETTEMHYAQIQQPVATVLRLSWRLPPANLQVGDEWWLPLRLKRVHSTLNPGGFDYEAWAFQNGIRAAGYVVSSLKPQRIAQARLSKWVERLRQGIEIEVEKRLPASQTSHWIVALLIGERHGIPPAEWEILRNTGTNHLMAIAGLHIGFMTAFVHVFFSRLWRCIPPLMLLMPAPIAGASAALVIAWFYSALAGFSIPTQRAVIMISIVLLTVLRRRVMSPWQAFCLALLIVLLLNPLSILSYSFWLSFTTIALIVHGMSGRLHPQGLWWKWARPQWVIALGLLPLSIWLFSEYSLISFIANSIAIPWVGFLVLPLCFASILLLGICPSLATLILQLADKSLSGLWVLLTFFSALPGANWHQAVPHYGYILAATLGVVLLLLPAGFPGKYTGFCGLLPLLCFKPLTPAYGEAQFTLLDVGQGLSAVVQTQHHALVFDAGARLSAEHNMGDSVVLPFLRAQGLSKLDLLIISHGDNDHRGGAEAILQEMPVMLIRTSVPWFFPSWNVDYCLRGSSWLWDGVRFSFLNPSPEQLNRGNNSSCVLQVATEGASVLIPGDIEREAEKAMLASVAPALAADILVAPHHGSNTSGLREFIGRVHPHYVLYALGYRNRYHFPHPAVVQSYRDWGVVQYDSVHSGAIQFTLGKRALLGPELYRRRYKRYWHEN